MTKVGNALAESMRNDEPEPPPMEFELVDEPEDPLVDADQPDHQIPGDEAQRQAEANSNPAHETRGPIRPDRPGSSPQQPAQQQEGDPQPEPAEPEDPGDQGEDDMHEAPDGQSSKSGKLNPVSLGGSSGALRAAFGEHGSHDDLRDVDEEETNVLKAKRNLYGSFFNRLRDRVAEHWEPERANKAVDPNQKIFGTSARTTVLWLQLDELGAITKVAVKRSSGAEHLDDEAIRAIKAAAPFPNPPEGLIDSDGHIEFDFGFTLDFVEGGRIFRHQR